MGCSSTKEKTSNSSLVFNPQFLRAIPDSSNKPHQSENLDRVPRKTIWEARVIIENEKNKHPISNKNALKQKSHRLKQISYIRLSLDDVIDTKFREVQNLHQSFRNIKSLNKLSLKCSYPFDSAGFLRTLSSELKKNAKSLKTFNLNIHEFIKTNDKEMKALLSLLDQLCYISNLKLNLKFTNGIMERLGSTLKHLRSLTTLNLTIVSSRHLNAKGIENFLRSLMLLPLLSNLSLVFPSCKEGIDDRGLQSLSSGLKYFSTLSTLHFKLYCNKKVSNQGIKNFLMSLGSLTWISGLDFGLIDCEQANDTVMESLCSILKQQLTSLSSLALMVDSCMGEQPITQLSHCFADLPLLSSLTIDSIAGWGTRTRNIDLEGLILALQQAKSLSSLRINLRLYYCINDKGIQVFSNHLRNLSSLSTFAVDFSFCERISNKGIESIDKALSQLTLLTTLSLKFMDCRSIRSGVTESLCAALKCLNLLSDLELEFHFLLKFDQNKLGEFVDQLKRVCPSLRSIKIQRYSCCIKDRYYF